jgi:XRE family transcriptional regulator, stress-response regulator
MVLLRHLLGDALRRLRLRQGRTLREVSASARVSLGYLSEVERGQKEASSELLAAICSALNAPLSQVLREVSDNFALAELQSEPVFTGVIEPAIEVPELERASVQGGEAGERPVAHVTSGPMDRPAPQRVAAGQIPAGTGPRVSAGSRQLPAGSLRTAPVAAGHLAAGQHGAGQVRSGIAVSGSLPISAGLTVTGPEFDEVSRSVRDITNMVPV